jgi:hypothetical protein
VEKRKTKMIKIALILVGSAIAFYFIVGRKIKDKIQTASDKKFKQEQQRAAWRDGYQAEKIKIAVEQGRAAARAEELQPTLDLRKIDGIQKKQAATLNEDTSKKSELILDTKKKPVCIEHNFEGKNWLDYARHIRKYHKKK